MNHSHYLKKQFNILAIDTSCDETSVAITSDDRVLTNIVYSQVELHKKWGGVVPSIAKRAHEEKIDLLIQEVFRKYNQQIARLEKTKYKIQNTQINAIAVTIGPGLAIALEVGIKKAKELSKQLNIPIIAINHMEGHLLSSFAKNSKGKTVNNLSPYKKITFLSKKKQIGKQIKYYNKVLGFLISGGHTELILMKGIGNYKKIGETIDDAAGECYDKVAKMLGLGYPGGPIISKLAKYGNPDKYKLPLPLVNHPGYNFSFSGLKTAVLYKLKKINKKGNFTKKQICDMAASSEKAIICHLTMQFDKAIKDFTPDIIVLGGGVISSLRIRNSLRKVAKKYNKKLYIPFSKNLFTDNAAMIAIAGWYKACQGNFVRNINNLDRKPNLSL